MQAPVVVKVTTDLPLFNAKKVRDYPHLQGLQLADPRFDTPGHIDIILDTDVWDQIELPGKIATWSTFTTKCQKHNFWLGNLWQMFRQC